MMEEQNTEQANASAPGPAAPAKECPDMEDLILDEASYDQKMDGEVAEYLKARKTVRYLPRGEGQTLYCASYLADDPAGTVIISHGFTETEEKYREIIYYFVKRHYHVYMPEHCGHGRSYRLVGDLSMVHVDTFSRYVRDLAYVSQLAEREHPDIPMYLYGHSMGGGIAAALLAVHPGMFRKAVLTSPMIRPLTNGMPWASTVRISAVLCRVGKSEHYVPGGHPYDGNEPFETSASGCRERYFYYQRKRKAEPYFQTTAASYGWLYASAGLNHYLRETAWKRITTPILLFQAEDDTLVVESEQEYFVNKINEAGLTTAVSVRVPDTKHEIFNSPKPVLTGYWKQVFDFLADA